MKKAITVALPVRNRDAARVEKLIGSVMKFGADPSIMLIDYGSSDAYSAEYRKIALTYKASYEKVCSQGRPWNKGHAINRGARLADTPVICHVDADVYFSTNPFASCLRIADERVIIHIETYWLDKSGDETKAVRAGHGNSGGFVALPLVAFGESGGYDERIVYWGMEDLDFPNRLIALGYKREWLPGAHRIFHQWHSSAESGDLRPQTAGFDTMRYCYENRFNPVLDQNWGMPLTIADRPILNSMKNYTPSILTLPKNALMHYGQIEKIIEAKKSTSFMKLELGERIVKRPLSRFSSQAKTLLRPFTAAVGLDCLEKLNRNFDFFYGVLPAFKKYGLTDFFIAADLSSVHLLWG